MNEVIEYAVDKTDANIKKTHIDSFHSGSTLTGVLFRGRSIFAFNVGDSRSILIKFKNSACKSDFVYEKNCNIISKSHRVSEERKHSPESGVRQASVFGTSKLANAASDVYLEDSMSKFEALALTTDHTCEVDKEQRRIL